MSLNLRTVGAYLALRLRVGLGTVGNVIEGSKRVQRVRGEHRNRDDRVAEWNKWGLVLGLGEWVKAHAELSELARRRAALDWEEGTALLRALRSGAHRHLWYASFAEYVERLFGYKPRATEEKLRVAQALESRRRSS